MRACVAPVFLVVLAGRANGAAEDNVGVVSRVQVVSSAVPDVSSVEAWKRSFIRDEMSEQEKALAVWKSVASFQHQDTPPKEYLQAGNTVIDPIKMFNVYGYSFCDVAASEAAALARFAGLQARGWTINAHVVSELFWDGAWHMLDSSLINYFPKPDGQLASVEEIVTGVKQWLAEHPGLKGNDARLRELMRGGGWKNGPAVLAQCPFYDQNGWLLAATHGWYSTMQEYDGSTLFPFESGASQGYEVNIQLRRGERLTRFWSNVGEHANMDEGFTPGAMTGKTGEGSLRYTPKLGDVAPGRVGRGLLEYDVPLADGAFRLGALKATNLASRAEDGVAPAMHVKNAAQPAIYIVRMPSSYIYLGGELTFGAAVGHAGKIVVQFSDNQGLDWRDVTTVTAAGEQKIDLKPFVLRRYDYRLKFDLHGPGTGLESLRISHPVQCSQRALPALVKGANTLQFSAGNEGTIALEGSTDLKNKSRQLVYTDFHPQLQEMNEAPLTPRARHGSITFPIETPGDLTRLRVGTTYRCRDAKDSWEVQLSFDGGATFQTADRLPGPHVMMSRYTVFDKVPAHTRHALVRLAGTQFNTTMLSNLRISADYREPHGGSAPVKITYRWREDGHPKEQTHVTDGPSASFAINCPTAPTMVSVALER